MRERRRVDALLGQPRGHVGEHFPVPRRRLDQHRAGRRGQRRRHDDAQVAQQTDDVAGPAHRHGRRPDRIFQREQAADDPRRQLAQRGVGIGVGRPRDRNHRRELGVAEGGEAAGHRRHHERQQDARPGILRGGQPGQHEDAGADDVADAEHDEARRAEHALQADARASPRLRRPAFRWIWSW